MQLLGARYDLPTLGRFLTQDPIGHEGGLNLYAYCGDSPLNGVDPSGLERRGLRDGEKVRLNVAAQFLIANGHPFAGGFYALMLKYNPSIFSIDTSIGGAQWEYNTLYLGPGLFESFDISKERDPNGVFHLNEFQSKAWFASILYHEFLHGIDERRSG